MKPGMWSRQTILKYTLMQLPEILVLVLGLVLIRHWIDISRYAAGWVIGLWIAKDIISYPFVWRAYAWQPSQSANEAMIGLKGTAKGQLNPSGYILVRGELWYARVIGQGTIIEEGQSVIVRQIRGLSLLVEPDPGKQNASEQTISSQEDQL